MLRRPSIPLAPEDKAACAKWSCGMLSIWALIVIATFTLPVFPGESADVSGVQARDHAAAWPEFRFGSADHVTTDPAVQR